MTVRGAIIGAALGAAVPVALTGSWAVFDHLFSSFEIAIWPSSILLMGADLSRRPGHILLIVAILINVAIYAAAGAFVTWAYKRHREAPQPEI